LFEKKRLSPVSYDCSYSNHHSVSFATFNESPTFPRRVSSRFYLKSYTYPFLFGAQPHMIKQTTTTTTTHF
jgi:hypothetical protein